MVATTALLQAPDHGPWYAETDLARFPAEPFNTFSNLVFLLILGLGVRRMWRSKIHSPIFILAYAILAVGWLGGTLYHATRSSEVWAMMDFAPIACLCLLASVWLVHRLSANSRRRYLLILLPALAGAGAGHHWLASATLRAGVVYAALATLVVSPGALHCAAAGGKRARILAGAVAAFATALFFRTYDASLISATPRTGTHFLWHLFGGLATYLIFEYVHQTYADERNAAGWKGIIRTAATNPGPPLPQSSSPTIFTAQSG